MHSNRISMDSAVLFWNECYSGIMFGVLYSKQRPKTLQWIFVHNCLLFSHDWDGFRSNL